jgi:hypothetical protein
MEFPNIYVCFPFNIAVLGRPELNLAEATWTYGMVEPGFQKQNYCWFQTAIQLARLGRTADAKEKVLERLNYTSLRFPTFYDTGSFCQKVDTDHAGVNMIALQEMLMQCFGKRILLGPAWPKDWDCEFKLHAPYQTTVEGRVAGGKVVVDKVTPESRRADIEIFPLK